MNLLTFSDDFLCRVLGVRELGGTEICGNLFLSGREGAGMAVAGGIRNVR